MHKKLLLIPILALFCIGWADSWDALESTAGTITSVQAEFVQEKHLPILAQPLVSEGAMYYQAPGSLRWEYRRPVHSVMLVHDGTIKRYVKGSEGFHEERGAGLEAMQVVLDQITQWMNGRFDQSPMFDARLDRSRRIVMTPKEAGMRAVIERIEIQLAEQPGVIDEVVIHESEAAYTRMRFLHTRLNEAIPASVFKDVP